MKGDSSGNWMLEKDRFSWAPLQLKVDHLRDDYVAAIGLRENSGDQLPAATFEPVREAADLPWKLLGAATLAAKSKKDEAQ
ncbi:MAG TPA: hypothetical protein VGM43_04980 [Bryobacteraceae bacterium]